jgi:zinc/manganese transport system substrate-binding protein
MHKIVLATVVAMVLGGSVLVGPARAQGDGIPISIVAAENCYGDIARQLAGPVAEVTSILSNPDEDPHLFEVNASVARKISGARLVIYNGIDYDPWMARLLRATTQASARQVIVVADLAGRKSGDNPHLWYDPSAMLVLAKRLSSDLAGADPVHAQAYQRRLQSFSNSLAVLDTRIAELRRKYAGTPVTATEPVFGYMATALGLEMRNQRFQVAVMNNTEPRGSDTAAFESDLRKRLVKVVIYNSQATDTAVQRLLRLAGQFHIPVVGGTETEPGGMTYQDWMTAQLDALDKALSAPAQ